MKPVLAIGDLNADLILTGLSGHPRYGREVLVRGCRMTLGGSAAIFACGLAALGHPVRFAGVVGRDATGEWLVDLMRKRGVDVAAVRRDGRVGTGIAVAFTRTDDRALVSYLGTVATARPRDLAIGSWRNVSHLHLTSPFLQFGLRDEFPSLLRRAKRAGLTTSFDPGWDPRDRWDLDRILPLVDLLFVNEVEARALTGLRKAEEAACRLWTRMRGDKTKTAVVKTGPKGAVAFTAAGWRRERPPSVEPIDTTGAGDTFDAGFLQAWLTGKTVDEALAFGCVCGAISTTKPGGYEGQPTRAQANRLMKRSR